MARGGGGHEVTFTDECWLDTGAETAYVRRYNMEVRIPGSS
jgi:hypothetical protein